MLPQGEWVAERQSGGMIWLFVRVEAVAGYWDDHEITQERSSRVGCRIRMITKCLYRKIKVNDHGLRAGNSPYLVRF